MLNANARMEMLNVNGMNENVKCNCMNRNTMCKRLFMFYVRWRFFRICCHISTFPGEFTKMKRNQLKSPVHFRVIKLLSQLKFTLASHLAKFTLSKSYDFCNTTITMQDLSNYRYSRKQQLHLH